MMMRPRHTALLLILGSALLLHAADPASAPPAKAKLDRQQAGRLSMIVGRILQGVHYKQAPLNDAVSGMFLTNYLDALDYSHSVFLQSDVDDLSKRYATTLDDAINRADPRPAFEVFDLYIKRLREQNDLVHKLLQEPFDFEGNDTLLRQRNKAPWPKDRTELEDFWRVRLKYDLLQDRLAKSKSQTKSKGTNAPLNAAQIKAANEDPVKKIQKRYDRLLKDMSEFDDEEIIQVYLGSLSRAYDPHTEYFGPREASNFDINHIKLSLSGIGARLRWEDGYTRVESLVPGGPADLSKQIKLNDRIVAVAQADAEPVDVVDMKLSKVVELIRGTRGTEVRLTIIPADSADDSDRKIVAIVRDEIKLKEQFAKAKVIDHPIADGATLRLGVISLPQFYDNCTRDVEKLIGRLKQEKIEGLVLDLRRNGGGLLDEAVSLTGLFIEEGPVVQVRDHRRETNVYEDTDDKVAYDGPLIVLVSRMSASASEIIAAALQDYGRALIVGDQSTHGKGTVQSMLSLTQFVRGENLPDPGKLKLTVSKFYRIAGGTTQKNGVTPDIVLPSLYDYMEIGEAHLPNALPADQISPAKYSASAKLAPSIAPLNEKSIARTRTQQDFIYLREDIDRLRKQREEKTIPVNLTRLTREREEQESRDKARKAERAQRKDPEEKIYAVSIDMVDEGKPLQATTRMKQKEDDQLASVQPAAATDDDELDPDADDEPAVDPILNETVNILSDFVRLTIAKPAPITANTSPTPAR